MGLGGWGSEVGRGKGFPTQLEGFPDLSGSWGVWVEVPLVASGSEGVSASDKDQKDPLGAQVPVPEGDTRPCNPGED